MLKATQSAERGKVGRDGEAKGKRVVDVRSGQGIWEEEASCSWDELCDVGYKESWSALRTRLEAI